MCKKHGEETPKTCCGKGKCCKALEKAAARQAAKDAESTAKKPDATPKAPQPPAP